MASSSNSSWLEVEQELGIQLLNLTPEEAFLIQEDLRKELSPVDKGEEFADAEEDDGLEFTDSEWTQIQSPPTPRLQDTRIAAIALAATQQSGVVRDADTVREYRRTLHRILHQHLPQTMIVQGCLHPAAAWNSFYDPNALPASCRPQLLPPPPTIRLTVTKSAYVFDRVAGRLAKVGDVTIRMRGRFLWAGAGAAEQGHWFSFNTAWGLDHSMAVVGVEIKLNSLYRLVNSKEDLLLPDCMSTLRKSSICLHSMSTRRGNPFSRWALLPSRDCRNFSDRYGCGTAVEDRSHQSQAPDASNSEQQQQLGSTVHMTILEEGMGVHAASSCEPVIDYSPVGTELMSTLPDDVMRNIQARLPLKPLFQSLLVNKDWHHAMWTPDFRAMQREFGPKDSHLVLEFSFDRTVDMFSCPLHPDRKDPYTLDSSVEQGLTSAYYPGERSHGLTRERYLQEPTWHQLTFVIPSGMRAVGHSKGLLCLMEASMIYLREDIPADLLPPVKHKLLMCDPLSNVTKWIAQPHIHPGCWHQEDFQLVGMVTHTNSPHYQLYAIYTLGPAQVYESSTNQWTITQAYVGAHCSEGQIGREELGLGTVCRGTLYVLGRCVERSGFCRLHGILRCHILGCDRHCHSHSLYSNSLHPEAQWIRQDLEMPEDFNQACHALIEDQQGRLLMLSSMLQAGPAAVIWSVSPESLEVRPIARLEVQTLSDWGYRSFNPEMWFQASDGLIYITVNNVPQLLVADLSSPFAEWWWLPPSPLSLLYRGLKGRYAAMPVCPRMDAFMSKLGPTLDHLW